MKFIKVKNVDGVKYSFWIYLLACIAVISYPIYVANTDSATQELNIYNIVFQTSLVFLSSLLAWHSGKRFHLNYLWICFLGTLGFVAPKTLNAVFAVLIFGNYDLNFLGFAIFASFISILFVGVAIFVISYPLQILQSK